MIDLKHICKFAQTRSDFRRWVDDLKTAAKRADKMVQVGYGEWPIRAYAESVVGNVIYDYVGSLNEGYYSYHLFKRELTDNLLRSLGIE